MNVQFLGSMLEKPTLDKNGNPLPEAALVGRSNVGKSSLINHLTCHKGLARISSKPGKTTLLNFYQVDNAFILVDLPGYGYAARSTQEQKEWSLHIDHYFKTRKTLKLILLLIDIRRELSDDDLQIIQWSEHYKKPVLLIFTKSDTLKAQKTRIYPPLPSMTYSIKDGASRTRLLKEIKTRLN